MKLKYKLVVSFLIIVIIPFALMGILLYANSKGASPMMSYFLEGFKSEESQRAIIDVIVSLGLVLVFTAGILVIWLYRSMISKISRLLYGANNIKEGNLNFSIATDGTDELSELMNTFEDMKERLRQDSEDKIATENEQRVLISNLAHDIKTPLTVIQGYAEGILDGVADTKEKQEMYLRTIGKKAQDLNILLNELTTYSNISTNRLPYDFEHINVRAFFEDLLSELEVDFTAMYGKIDYEVDVKPDAEMIVDPDKFRRVIENIVDNSVKYKREEPLRMRVKVTEVDSFIQLEMEDNGIGIKSEELPYIFERTYRADVSRKSSVGGSGLGLSICKKIMEDHGGKIWATSRLNVGTCMYILIRQYTLQKQEDGKDEKNSDNRRRRSNSRA